MDPDIWIPIAVGVVGLLLMWHRGVRDRRKMALAESDTRIRELVALELRPIVKDLQDATHLLSNGINKAVKQNSANIAGMELSLANMVGQLEILIPGFHAKE